MVLEFRVNNYRSYKNEAKFSMLADSARLKNGNYFEIPEKSGKKDLRILKTAVIYGANASGKSNLIKALSDLVKFIISKPDVNVRLKLYDPFQFNSNSSTAPSTFELSFIGPNGYKYIYYLKISSRLVIEERLDYLPDGKIKNLYNRTNSEDLKLDNKTNDTELIEIFNFDGKEYKLFRNQLFLSTFSQEAHSTLTSIYLYFKNTFQLSDTMFSTENEVSKELINDEILKSQLTHLMKTADTKINGFNIHRFTDLYEQLKLDLKGLNKDLFRDSFMTYSEHDYYDDDVLRQNNYPFQFSDESEGSKTLYKLGSKILKAIESGKVMIYDELDTSLHSYVTKMLVLLFLSPKINTKGAQLIFTTHDISLLDKDLLRKDQIWFAEKDERGVTDLYSLQDFDGLREDIPFDKWYMAGKFGGLPNIGEIEKIFEAKSISSSSESEID